MRRVEALLVAVVLAVFAVGIALLPLQMPWLTRTLSARYSKLPPAEAAPLAEAARQYVTSGDIDARRKLEDSLAPDAIPHLDDVERVLTGARLAVVALAIGLALWFALRGRHELRSVAEAFGLAAVFLLAGMVIIGVTALIDFTSFFSAFHELFFEPGTWTFPSDSVLIRLLPEPFWAAAAGVWGAVVAVIGVVYAAAAVAIVRRAEGEAIA